MPASDWSEVDASALPGRFVHGLDSLRADPFFVTQKARILEWLELRGGDRVVDVGCGTGEDLADLARSGCVTVGIERSSVLLDEARRRHPDAVLVAGDARALPFGDATLERVRVDRVLQHLEAAPGALREWRRVLRPGGVLTVFEPDLTSARIVGMDTDVAEAVVRWRAGTRPGADAVRGMAEALSAARFEAVEVDAVVLDLDDLRRADGMMGLPEWGELAANAGALAPDAARRWRDDALRAWSAGDLRYSCTYLHGRARVS